MDPMHREAGARPHHPPGAQPHHPPGAWRRRRSVRRYVRRRLHRRIFLWFGASILATCMVAWTAFVLVADRAPWHGDLRRAESFVGNRLAEAWTDPLARQRLVQALADDLDVQITVEDTTGAVVARAGDPCLGHAHHLPVPGASTPTPGALGRVALCRPGAHGRSGWAAAGALAAAGLCLWLASGRIARRLVRPLDEIVRVARDIGDGKLASRARLSCRDPDELGVLGGAINDMATRIEKQLADQRQLLAAVSHEIRTPLGHMRVLVELARDSAAPARRLDELEREILAVDSLVGQLLASSRLEFDTIERRGLDARALATSTLERAGLDPALVRVDLADTAIAGDPTLLARALANLIENAQTHGGGVTALVITAPPDSGSERLAFEVHDHGPGFVDTEPARVFDPFYRGKPTHAAAEHAALGLGLALVRRIARAHGGDAWARNREAPGGACVGFSLRRHDPGEPGRDT